MSTDGGLRIDIIIIEASRQAVVVKTAMLCPLALVAAALHTVRRASPGARCSSRPSRPATRRAESAGKQASKQARVPSGPPVKSQPIMP